MLKIGDEIKQRYRICQSLGAGGFGKVYLAVDLDQFNKPCVVKHLCPVGPNRQHMAELKRRFELEAVQLNNLGISEHIPALMAFPEEYGELYIVQAWVDGWDLSQQEILPGKPLSEGQVIKLLKEILSVLQVVHRAQIVHRDLKPANIMRRRLDRKLVLIDFGGVKELANSAQQTGGQPQRSYGVYTEGYAAPEQMQGHPLLASDVYAVGAIAVEALVGIAPCSLYDASLGELVWHNQVKISRGLRQVIDRMLAHQAKNRYASATAVLDALEALDVPPQSNVKTIAVGRQPLVEPNQPPSVPNQPPSVKRRPFLKWVGFGVIGLTGVGLGRLMSRSEGTKMPEVTRSQLLEDFEFKTVQLSDKGDITKRETLQGKLFTQKIDDVGLPMVQIPAGNFLMGSPDAEVGRRKAEGPQHEVSVPAFFMSQTPITQAQWKAVAKLPKVNIDLNQDPSAFKGDLRPVNQVSWWEAQEFCDRLSQGAKLTYRLPSEAEWEYACRAGTTTPFHVGETLTTDVANYRGTDWDFNSKTYPGNYGNGPKGKFREQTTDVQTFPANPWGLYDVHGNVWEWCADHWHDSYDKAPIDGTAWLTDKKDANRLLRGGSWFLNPVNCRAADRYSDTPGLRYSYVSFRVCVSVSA